MKGFLYNSEALKVDQTVVLFKLVGTVVKEHIEVQLMERGKVEVARREIDEVNKKLDISAKEWVEAQ